MIRQVPFDDVRQMQIIIPVVVAVVTADRAKLGDGGFSLGNPLVVFGFHGIITKLLKAFEQQAHPCLTLALQKRSFIHRHLPEQLYHKCQI